MGISQVLSALVILGQITRSSSQGTHYISRCYLEDFSCDSLACDDIPQKASSESCSCHPACRYFNDCCLDVRDYYQRCTGNLMMPDATRSLRSYSFECIDDAVTGNSYWMVSSCPSHWSGNTGGCSDENITVGRFEDGLVAVPVASNSSGITFGNVFCALCNGENLTNLRPWAIEAECPEETRHPNMSVVQLIEFTLANCSYVRLSPNVSDLQLNYNYQVPCPAAFDVSLIDTCPDSVGESDTAPSHECGTIWAPLKVAGLKFRNRHFVECYLAKDNETITWAPCFIRGVVRPPGDRTDGLVLLPTSIILANFDQTSVGCSDGEIFDDINSICRQLHCSSGYKLVNNVCTPSITRGIIEVQQEPNDEVELYVTAEYTGVPYPSCGMAWSRLFYACLEYMWNIQSTSSLIVTEQCTGEEGSMVFISNITYSSVDILAKVWFTNSTKLRFKSDSCSSLKRIQVTGIGNRFEETGCSSEWLRHSDDQSQEMNGPPSSGSNGSYISSFVTRRTISFAPNGSISSRRMYRVSGRAGCDSDVAACPKILMNASEFHPVDNDSDILVYAKNTSVQITPGDYFLRDNGTIEVCNFFEDSPVTDSQGWYNYDGYTIITATGSTLSIPSLLFCLVTYGVFESLRSTISKILTMILSLNLLIASISMILVVAATKIPVICSFVAWSIHFFYMATFTTSSVIGAHFIQSFRVKLRSTNSVMTPLQLTLNLGICYGIPALISIALLASRLATEWGVSFGDERRCLIGQARVTTWAFLVPCGVSVSFNLLSFIYVVVVIAIQTRGRKALVKSNRFKETVKSFRVFFRISTVLGLTWVFGFVGTLAKQPTLLYIFDSLTPFQGFFVFMSFMCRRKTWRLWKQQLSKTVAPDDPTSSKNTTGTAVSAPFNRDGLGSQGQGQ